MIKAMGLAIMVVMVVLARGRWQLWLLRRRVLWLLLRLLLLRLLLHRVVGGRKIWVVASMSSGHWRHYLGTLDMHGRSHARAAHMRPHRSVHGAVHW